VDNWPGFINQFNQNAQAKNLQDRVKGIVGDMGNLPFREEELDLIWSEGAIYNKGCSNAKSRLSSYCNIYVA